MTTMVSIRAEYIALAKEHFPDKTEEQLGNAFDLILHPSKIIGIHPLSRIAVCELLLSQLQCVEAACTTVNKEFYRNKIREIGTVIPEAKRLAKKYEQEFNNEHQ